MKPSTKLFMLSAGLITRAALAVIVLASANGTDGALNITGDTVIDLSEASRFSRFSYSGLEPRWCIRLAQISFYNTP